jgi:hypothetical protein
VYGARAYWLSFLSHGRFPKGDWVPLTCAFLKCAAAPPRRAPSAPHPTPPQYGFLIVIMIHLYTATLASRLTQQRLANDIRSKADLPGKPVETW